MSMTQSLHVSVGNLSLATPVMLASGTLGEFPDKLACALRMGAGAVVTRTIRQFNDPARSRTPAPRYFISGGTMLNCEWNNSLPWSLWLEQGIDQVSQYGPLILSVSGRDVESAVNLINEFDKKDVAAYELNISCPHSNRLFGQINQDYTHLRTLLRKVKRVTSRPVWVKLGWSSFITEMAKVAEDEGANAVVATNSWPGMVIDVENAKPALGIKGGIGGVSGRAIHPLVLAIVFELAQTLSIPVVGCGGIGNAYDVLAYLMVGASAVQLYTAAFLRGLNIFQQINEDMVHYLVRKGLDSIKQVQGIIKDKVSAHNFEFRPPVVDVVSCTSCGHCVRVCQWNALPTEMPGSINEDLCVGCNACVYVCPMGCIRPRWL